MRSLCSLVIPDDRYCQARAIANEIAGGQGGRAHRLLADALLLDMLRDFEAAGQPWQPSEYENLDSWECTAWFTLEPTTAADILADQASVRDLLLMRRDDPAAYRALPQQWIFGDPRPSMKVRKLTRRIAGRRQILQAFLLMEVRHSLVWQAADEAAETNVRMAARLEQILINDQDGCERRRRGGPPPSWPGATAEQ